MRDEVPEVLLAELIEDIQGHVQRIIQDIHVEPPAGMTQEVWRGIPVWRQRYRKPTSALTPWERLEAWLWLKRQRDKAFEERMSRDGDELLIPGEVEFHVEGSDEEDDDEGPEVH